MTNEAAGVDYDVVVIGAGAAGLVAAMRAAEMGKRVLLLERNRRPGVKILMSGGTRCNVTNARGLRRIESVSGPIDPEFDPKLCRGIRAIQAAFGEAGGKFLGPSLKALDVDATVRLFEAEGLALKVEANGKLFPTTDRAIDVLDALTRRLERSGAELRTESAVTGIERLVEGEGFAVALADARVTSKRVVIAVGGQSYPGCGTKGDGYDWARLFGHTIVEPKPALVPIKVDAAWVPELKGITLPDVKARVVGADGAVYLERREALLFAHFGLTGPAVLDVSRAVARETDPASLRLALDLVPDDRPEQLEQGLQAASRSGRSLVANLLPGDLPRRIAQAVLEVAGVPETRVGPEMSREERKRLVSTLKDLRLPIAGTLGFAKAEVTSGGVALDEVNPQTLESRRVPGLHFVGEVLDLDGLIGGYNFQAAWSTGWRVGEVV